jgi:hypothetical protein
MTHANLEHRVRRCRTRQINRFHNRALNGLRQRGDGARNLLRGRGTRAARRAPPPAVDTVVATRTAAMVAAVMAGSRDWHHDRRSNQEQAGEVPHKASIGLSYT